MLNAQQNKIRGYKPSIINREAADLTVFEMIMGKDRITSVSFTNLSQFGLSI